MPSPINVIWLRLISNILGNQAVVPLLFVPLPFLLNPFLFYLCYTCQIFTTSDSSLKLRANAKMATADYIIRRRWQANPVCQLCQARDESKCILWPSAEMQKKYGTWWWYRIKWWSPMQVICKGSAELHFSTLRAGVIGWSCTFVHNLLFFFRLYKL